MAAGTFKTQDGTKITDGDEVTLVLLYDGGELLDDAGNPVRERYAEVEATGTVRQFDHVERKYDEEGIAVGKTTTKHWEISTADPQHPAVGFLPENVKTRLGQ